jgi:hypothetical protein
MPSFAQAFDALGQVVMVRENFVENFGSSFFRLLIEKQRRILSHFHVYFTLPACMRVHQLSAAFFREG